jgi:Ca2+-binding RTX toxin-like protein
MEGLPEKKEKHMRRTIALLTTMAMMLLVATSVAVAGNVFCTNPGPCYGTDYADYIWGVDGGGGNSIFAKGGDDQVIATAGTNSLYGGAGNDLLYGENGNDTMYGNAGDDTMGGYGGTDTANFSGSPAAITASLATNSAKGEGLDTLSGMENLLGSKYNDTLTGSSGANTLTGVAGKDSFYGGYGNDTINALDYGGNVGGADGRISCGAGYDTVAYDRYLDVPDGDCEKKTAFPIAAQQ